MCRAAGQGDTLCRISQRCMRIVYSDTATESFSAGWEFHHTQCPCVRTSAHYPCLSWQVETFLNAKIVALCSEFCGHPQWLWVQTPLSKAQGRARSSAGSHNGPIQRCSTGGGWTLVLSLSTSSLFVHGTLTQQWVLLSGAIINILLSLSISSVSVFAVTETQNNGCLT